MGNKPIKVLFVEDDTDMVSLIRRYLSLAKNQTFDFESADRLSVALDALKCRNYDIILLDLNLPDSQKLDTLGRVIVGATEKPIVVLSSLDDEELALKAVQAGAQDYVVKQQLNAGLLIRVILYALERNRLRVELNWHTCALKLSEERFRRVIENVTDAIIILNREGGICFVNPAAETLFKQKSEALLGTSFGFPVVPGKTTELELSDGDGKSLVAEVRASVIDWEGTSAYLASLRNITIRKQVEQKLTNANEDLRQLNQMKSDFVSTVSHELRTPLTAIKNSISIMSNGNGGLVDKRQGRLLTIASRNIDRLSTMVEELLDLSRIEAGKLKLHISEVDLGEMIEHVMATFQSEAANKSIRLASQMPTDTATLYTDSGRVEQILCNLVSNAIKYTLDGGRVTLSLEVERDRVAISVEDTGVGLSPVEQKRIFDRFYQVEPEITATSDGFGLGLYIVQKLVTELSGEISLESESGKGSRFFFTLPILSAQAADKTLLEDEIRKCWAGQFYSVLVVDLTEPKLSKLHRAGHDTNETFCRQMVELAENALSRSTDRVLHQKSLNRLVIVLGGTAKAAAGMAKQKLEKVFEQNADIYKAILNTPPNISGPYTYPDDADSVTALIDCVDREKDGAIQNGKKKNSGR